MTYTSKVPLVISISYGSEEAFYDVSEMIEFDEGAIKLGLRGISHLAMTEQHHVTHVGTPLNANTWPNSLHPQLMSRLLEALRSVSMHNRIIQFTSKLYFYST